MVFFQVYKPRAPLSYFVNMFWLYNGYHPDHKMEHVMPDGTMQMIINLDEDRIKVYDQKNQNRFKSHRGSLISGPHSDYTVIDTACQSSTLGVHFKIGGAFPFIRMPSEELRNVHVTLETLWGRQASNLREKLIRARTSKAKFHILEQYLFKVMTKSPVHHPAVSYALMKLKAAPNKWQVTDMAKHVGLGSRRFIQIFKKEVGLTPKQFCRVQRFQNVVQFMEGEEQFDWIDLAFNFGFYDQAHLIHEFRTFSGFSPARYHSLYGKQHNHVPIDG